MEEKIFAKGFKGLDPNMKCRGKQYAENTVFEEKGGEICNEGVMHFCEYPLDVFGYYPPAVDGKINTFAAVEALEDTQKEDEKSSTTKLKIGAKINLADLCQAAVDFIMERVKNKNKKEGDKSSATNTGDQSAATNTGDQSAATNTGFRSAATNTGFRSAASVEGKDSFAIATGMDCKVKGALGCFIACAEWAKDESGNVKPVAFKATKVDGEIIKTDTWYTVRDGKFVEVEGE